MHSINYIRLTTLCSAFLPPYSRLYSQRRLIRIIRVISDKALLLLHFYTLISDKTIWNKMLSYTHFIFLRSFSTVIPVLALRLFTPIFIFSFAPTSRYYMPHKANISIRFFLLKEHNQNKQQQRKNKQTTTQKTTTKKFRIFHCFAFFCTSFFLDHISTSFAFSL